MTVTGPRFRGQNRVSRGHPVLLKQSCKALSDRSFQQICFLLKFVLLKSCYVKGYLI